MNILKTGKKQSRKKALIEEASFGLPDVVADLCLWDSYNTDTIDMICDSASMQGFTGNMDESMLEYSSHFTPITEPTAFRRIPSHAVPTAGGLGAGPMPLENHGDQNWHGPEPSNFSKRNDQCNPRRPDPAFQNSSSGPPPIFVNTLRPENGIGACFTDLDNFRLRSVSSEPRGPNNEQGERRNRCSSTSRNRQSRHRQQVSGVSNHHLPIISPPISPPMSPPTQRVQWNSPSRATMNGSNLVSPISPPQSYRNENQSRDIHRDATNLIGAARDLSNPGRSYGYQVADLDALLTQSSPTRPANLPMVLGSSTKLHNMRLTHGSQNIQTARSFLPLGIIVNAVFKTRDWLYVRTAHGAEGYVPYRVCLPLGILPLNTSNVHHDHTLPPPDPVWESAGNDNLSSQALYRSRTNPGKGFPSVESHHRSRPRARRRHMMTSSEFANQTDSQKLQPTLTNGESRERENSREAVQPIVYAPHLV